MIMTATAQKANDDFARCRELAEAKGFTLSEREIIRRAPGEEDVVTAWHWLLDRKGRRVIDYWPTNGKYRIPETGDTGFGSFDDVVRIANLF